MADTEIEVKEVERTLETRSPVHVQTFWSAIDCGSYLSVLVAAALFLACVIGLGLVIGFGFYRENSHFRSAKCDVLSCNVSGRLCGSDCGRDQCNTRVCLDVKMLLRLVTEPISRVYSTTIVVWSGDKAYLLDPPNCTFVVPSYSNPIRCRYDDRNVAGSLTLNQLLVSAGVVVGICLLSVAGLVSGAVLLILTCHFWRVIA